MLQDSNPASPLDRPVHTDASPPGPKGWPLLGSLIGFARDCPPSALLRQIEGLHERRMAGSS
ncbi:protein of unknown function [Methylorubrum extorquens]|uniref:Uncharacterized protein n=1 Tax=Methylorubrum extorquens TaxID=408 RepID=A0A2N9AXK8_METEX|nr:protein of unknown function [Methylorubrum extorquens]